MNLEQKLAKSVKICQINLLTYYRVFMDHGVVRKITLPCEVSSCLKYRKPRKGYLVFLSALNDAFIAVSEYKMCFIFISCYYRFYWFGYERFLCVLSFAVWTVDCV